jgi:hypothetical protein
MNFAEEMRHFPTAQFFGGDQELSRVFNLINPGQRLAEFTFSEKFRIQW